MASISLQNLRKSFGTASVLKDISLDIADGEFLTLLGPSGCGKSTLLRIIAGLDVQDEGAIAIGDRLVDALPPKQRDIAMVFQSYALYPHMNVAQNMALPLRMRRLSRWQRLPFVRHVHSRTKSVERGIARDVAETAEAIGIGHLLARKPAQLSGGQRQRVAVGRAMVRRPTVFLMDEPLSNLDAKLRVQMRAEIKELHRSLGATFVYVTHDQAEAMTLSDRVAIMLDGEILQVAAPQKIYAEPADRRVAEFVGSPKINLLTAIVQDRSTVDVAGSKLAIETGLPAGAPVTLGLRPEALQIADIPGPETLKGAIRLIEHLGSDLFVHLGCANATEPVIARIPAERAAHLEVGDTLHLAVRTDRALLFDGDGRRIVAGPSLATLRRSA